jgi:hypothetical protein
MVAPAGFDSREGQATAGNSLRATGRTGHPEGDAPGLEEHIELFALGRACYRERRWQDAQIVFEKVLERWPDDGPARMYVNRCREYIVAGPEQDWEGVYVMTHK